MTTETTLIEIYKRRRATIIEIQRICEEALDHDYPYNLVKQSIEDALRKEKEESERVPTWGEVEARKIREKANKLTKEEREELGKEFDRLLKEGDSIFGLQNVKNSP